MGQPKRQSLPLLALLACTAAAPAQAIPALITGKWRIVKILPTHNPQCWTADRAISLLGTTLLYQPHTMSWATGAVSISAALTRTLTRHKFADEYSLELPELHILAPSVEEIDLQHEDADITGSTTEVPGDTIFLAGPGRIVISACGVFYAAVRAATPKPGISR
jgi:hypothetical protein